MAVAEARKMDKPETVSTGSSSAPSWLLWLPGKLKELRTFFSEVRSELKKVTWPSRDEVQTTTIVVIVTTTIFGFYLYGIDLLLSQIFTRILR
jgi:preprotein translocase subunit SecE